MVKIAVIGAGIVGYSSAVNIQRAIPGAQVTIIADQFGDQLVSHGPAGIFRPVLSTLVKGENEQFIKQWLRDSWDHFSSLAVSEHAKESGQMMIFGLLSHRKDMDYDYSMLRDCAFDFRKISDSERRKRGIPEEFKYTYACTSVMTQTPIYIPWLKKQFESKGGMIQKRTVRKLEDLYGEFQLVINCCGARARTFVGDTECFPNRGQLARVKAPWFKHYHYFDTDITIFPHTDKVNIGVLRLPGDGNRDVDPEITKTMIKGAEKFYPRLKGAEFISSWAHTRPGRSRPRVEIDTLNLGRNKELTVIHNYGHGGHGVTLSWGCGVHVARLAKQALPSLIPKAAL